MDDNRIVGHSLIAMPEVKHHCLILLVSLGGKRVYIVESGILELTKIESTFHLRWLSRKIANLRNSIVAFLRERGWLVHGRNCAEEALRLLAHIPYSLIVVDSELPGMGGIDFGRVLQNSRRCYQQFR
jgi:CheY-like chemotaxis protein